jgi:hypothetical protein
MKNRQWIALNLLALVGIVTGFWLLRKDKESPAKKPIYENKVEIEGPPSNETVTSRPDQPKGATLRTSPRLDPGPVGSDTAQGLDPVIASLRTMIVDIIGVQPAVVRQNPNSPPGSPPNIPVGIREEGEGNPIFDNASPRSRKVDVAAADLGCGCSSVNTGQRMDGNGQPIGDENLPSGGAKATQPPVKDETVHRIVLQTPQMEDAKAQLTPITSALPQFATHPGSFDAVHIARFLKADYPFWYTVDSLSGYAVRLNSKQDLRRNRSMVAPFSGILLFYSFDDPNDPLQYHESSCKTFGAGDAVPLDLPAGSQTHGMMMVMLWQKGAGGKIMIETEGEAN